VVGLNKHGTRFLIRDPKFGFVPMSHQRACDHVKLMLKRGISRYVVPKAKNSDVVPFAPKPVDQPDDGAPVVATTAAAAAGSDLDDSTPRTAEQSGPRPSRPHPNDVLLGRGHVISNHPGNQRFRTFARMEKER
jgi:hypothetical protein